MCRGDRCLAGTGEGPCHGAGGSSFWVGGARGGIQPLGGQIFEHTLEALVHLAGARELLAFRLHIKNLNPAARAASANERP
jgi:hypothetical protein